MMILSLQCLSEIFEKTEKNRGHHYCTPQNSRFLQTFVQTRNSTVTNISSKALEKNESKNGLCFKKAGLSVFVNEQEIKKSTKKP